jgi:PleD family two-component response regulator
MGGHIGVDSAPGRGSTFWIELGLQKASAPVEEPVASTTALAGRRILVVDDHATNRRALHSQITAWGVRPLEVAGGAEAIDALSAALATDR